MDLVTLILPTISNDISIIDDWSINLLIIQTTKLIWFI